MEQKMNQEVEKHAKFISDWLRKNRNPYTTIEITEGGVKMTSAEEFIPTTEVKGN